MKTKNKLFKTILGTIGTLTVTSLPLCLMSACGNGATDKELVEQKKTNPSQPIQDEEDNRVKYTTVEFHIPEGDDISYTGKTKITAKVGEQFCTLTAPAVSKYGHKFLHWSKEEDQDTPIGATETVPDPETGYWHLYPIFQDNVTLSQCVGISTIETTTITVTRSAGLDVNLYYTDNYGEDWKMIFDDHDPISPTNPLTDVEFTIPELKPGENIFLRGDNPNGFSKSDTQYVNFSFSSGSAVNIMGNIMGLLDKASAKIRTIPNPYCFYRLFRAESPDKAAIQYISNTFLDVTQLNDHCYQEMFYGCANLINAPWLSTDWHNEETNEDTVPVYCYNSMFYGCASLQTLRLSYDGDFNDEATNFCFTSWLYGTPESGEILFNGTVPTTGRTTDNIPAKWTVVKPWDPVDPDDPTASFTVECSDSETTAAGYKYTVDHPYQFKANVGEQHSDRLTWFSSNSEYLDVNPETGVATPLKATPNGESVYVVAYSKYSMDWWGAIGIQTKSLDLDNCMHFTSEQAGTTVAWEYVGDIGTTNLKYSTDGGNNWLKFWPGPSSAVTLAANQTLYVKGNNITGLNDPSTAEKEKENAYTHFIVNGKASVGGKLMALIDDGRAEKTAIPSKYCFNHLFYECDGLTSVENTGFFNATTLNEGCYYSMFEWCTNLLTAGSTNQIGVESTTLSQYSCTRMFYHCPSLQTAAKMPAKTLQPYCCWRMFEFDSALTASPALPATNGADSCYRMMFQQCTNLKSAGEVSLSTLADNACYQMFVDTGLNITTDDDYTFFWKTPDSSASYENPMYHAFPARSYGESGWTPSNGTKYYYK